MCSLSLSCDGRCLLNSFPLRPIHKSETLDYPSLQIQSTKSMNDNVTLDQEGEEHWNGWQGEHNGVRTQTISAVKWGVALEVDRCPPWCVGAWEVTHQWSRPTGTAALLRWEWHWVQRTSSCSAYRVSSGWRRVERRCFEAEGEGEASTPCWRSRGTQGMSCNTLVMFHLVWTGSAWDKKNRHFLLSLSRKPLCLWDFYHHNVAGYCLSKCSPIHWRVILLPSTFNTVTRVTLLLD